MDFSAQHIVKCSQQIEGLLVKPSRIRLEKLAAADPPPRGDSGLLSIKL